MKIVAYYGLHYGREWFEWSLRWMAPFVDETHIFYTPHPSHGTQTSMTIPLLETRAELALTAALAGATWHDVDQFFQEGAHRDYAVNWCFQNGADLVIAPDADEIWDPDELERAIAQALDGPHRLYRARVQGHFWKGVNWVCRDECWPVRFLKPLGDDQDGFIEGPGFWHFGYAQSEMLVLYKMRIHGHRNEIRKGWYLEKFKDWKPGIGDVHPTNIDFWTPEPFSREEIAYLIADHPYFSDEMV